jgi:hypothetical protein
MDVSGSMDESKRYLARIFFWLLVNFVRAKYETAVVVFIGHDTRARECTTEEEFFHRSAAGGTAFSSAYDLALGIIAERYPPDAYNLYAFHCSDGVNFGGDNARALELAGKLAERCALFGYGEIDPPEEYGSLFQGTGGGSWSKMFEVLQPLAEHHDNVGFVRIHSQEDVYPNFRDLLKRERHRAKGGSRGSV